MMRLDISRLAVASAAALLIGFGVGARPVHAQPEPLETYTARLSEQDHFNSNGERLTTVAGIIRQDRANFFVFGKRDSEDTSDDFFASKANRARLEAMLLHGRISRSTTNEIVNHTPLIVVKVWEDYVWVDVYGR